MQPIQDLDQLIDIKHPIIQAPMAGGATTPDLVAAVSNAGGLGSLGAGYMSPHDIQHAIESIRQLTDGAFAVNLFIPSPHDASATLIQQGLHAIEQACTELGLTIEPVSAPYCQSFTQQIQVVIEQKAPVFSFTFGSLDSHWIKRLKQNNTILIGTATTLAEAQLLEQQGIDIIVAQGLEAGGHRGTFLEAAEKSLHETSTLVRQLAQHIKSPIIASGGIMNKQGINKQRELGAAGVQIGTAFLTCHEAGINNTYKKTLLAQQQDDTMLTRAFSGKLARGINNTFTQRMQAHTTAIVDYPIQNKLTRSMRTAALQQCNPEFMSLWAGQGVALCQNMSASELMAQLIND